MLLGDAGASVLKLERPKTGDDTRSWGPPFLPHGKKKSSNSMSTYFLSVNRNKKSIAVDLQKERGRDICYRIATEWADVVVENFKVGTLDRLGLGYDVLREKNPGLVYCSISGFGTTGPKRDDLGYDLIVSGMYGLMSITGHDDETPAKVGVAITDVLTGTLAQGGILAALHERNTTGRGQRVDTSLMESQLASLVNIGASSLNAPSGTAPPKRWGTAHESIVPYQAFACKPNGTNPYLIVGAGNDSQFHKLCHVLGLSQLPMDIKFSSNSARVANREELIALMKHKFVEKPRDEWIRLLEGHGFPMGPIRTVPEAFRCEQAVHRGMVKEFNHPVAGKVSLPGPPVKYSGNLDYSDFLPPPMLGEHTEEILLSLLRFDTHTIRQLERSGVVECWKNIAL